MSQSNRTNPAYAYLAYRRAVIQHVAHVLTTEYTAPVGEDPNQHIYADDVFRCDAEVPVPDVVGFIEELQAEDARLQLEMNKFEFRALEQPRTSFLEHFQKAMINESKEPSGGSVPPATGQTH